MAFRPRFLYKLQISISPDVLNISCIRYNMYNNTGGGRSGMKRRMHASLILMALCIYLQWGRGVSVRNTISSSRDGKRTEHITIVANKLYIGDKEAIAGR